MVEEVKIEVYKNVDIKSFFIENGVKSSDLGEFLTAPIVLVPPRNISILKSQTSELSDKILNFTGSQSKSTVRPDIPIFYGSGVEIDLTIVTTVYLLPILQGLISAWIYDKLIIRRREPS